MQKHVYDNQNKKQNSTNNNLEKFGYITNNESRIFMQEETNFIVVVVVVVVVVIVGRTDIPVFPFYRLLELNPDIQDTFPSFKGVALDELMNSRSLFLHSKRLMAAVEKAVSSLEDGQEIVERLTDLGQRHIAISITEKHFKVRKACQRKHVQM